MFKFNNLCEPRNNNIGDNINLVSKIPTMYATVLFFSALHAANFTGAFDFLVRAGPYVTCYILKETGHFLFWFLLIIMKRVLMTFDYQF